MLKKEHSDILRRLGFIHVTGLPFRFHSEFHSEIGVIRSEIKWLGRHDYNNGRTVVHTLDGEVWLLDNGIQKNDVREFLELMAQICPKGNGAWVPCSNGEEICDGRFQNTVTSISASKLLTKRVADPYDAFGGRVPIDGQSITFDKLVPAT